MFEVLLAGKDFGPPPVGEIQYSGGTYSFTVPLRVRELSAVVVGSGQPGRNSGNETFGGKGGNLRWIKTFAVTPGEVLTVVCGGNGTESFIRRANGTMILVADGGATTGLSTPINLPNIGGGEGGAGGVGTIQQAGAGGGAGGYSGDGGAGFPQFTPGAGGAGAGGYGSVSSNSLGYMGGGVGLFGEGPSGTSMGQGGSGGADGTFVNAGGWGSGGATRWSGDNQSDYWYTGYNGAVRLIWGNGRSFPDNAAQVV